MKDLKIVVNLMFREKKDVFYSILFGFLAGIGAVSLFANSGYLISKAAIMPPLYVLTISIALLKLFSVTRAVSRYGERYFSHRATFTKLSNLRQYFFEKLEPLAPQIFQKYRSGDLLSRIVGDVESLQNFFLRVYYPPIVMVIVFLATIAFTAFFSIAVAIALVLGLIITGFLVPLWFSLKRKEIDNQLRESRGTVSTEAIEFFYGFRDLKLYYRLDEQANNLVNASATYVNEQRKVAGNELYNQSVNQLISLIVSWIVLGMGAYFVAEGQLDGVFLAMLVMVSLTVFENSTPMAAFPGYYHDSRRAANRLFSVVEKEEENSWEEKLEIEEVNINRPPTIELQNVNFSFPYEDRLALKDINLHLQSGSKTAIVGPSGSGKSTLLMLLLKVFSRNEGEVKLWNKSIGKLMDEDIWNGTNIALQSNHFFYGTIRDNLRIAKDGLSDDEMKAVLNKVKLQQFSLSDPVLEKGENLSGGEKQRLAIARAMLKGSHLWLLDEPTSSVDILTESHIYKELMKQGENDTMIFVSHRLTGLEKMDQIIVMENGTIIETGSYDELMNKKGYFYKMKEIEKDVFL
ncbi:thiol reductant ABC exporter subunit CydC [Evansella sp. AB-P1]|uniref:thiol reductant ABC exporter subunit CydC n=1 Tax=Evansella sp. AB-P1 TaxID=3037653 RepID=UPI00241E76DF|nr:thiol reductant ABC exporter subunit CydC [Evansella sp. AB-P1]MDG5788030.1 thiol reductant ABC exporter subunit CydC [Evansella sp. AB-P1]